MTNILHYKLFTNVFDVRIIYSSFSRLSFFFVRFTWIIYVLRNNIVLFSTQPYDNFTFFISNNWLPVSTIFFLKTLTKLHSIFPSLNFQLEAFRSKTKVANHPSNTVHDFVLTKPTPQPENNSYDWLKSSPMIASLLATDSIASSVCWWANSTARPLGAALREWWICWSITCCNNGPLVT